MNGNAFLAYVEQVLAPTLKPGNDLSAAGMDEAVEAAGARLLYLPPYSGVNNFAFFSMCVAAFKAVLVESRSEAAFELFSARPVEDRAHQPKRPTRTS